MVLFPGPLLLVVFFRVLMEVIRPAHRVTSMDIIDLGVTFSLKKPSLFSSDISKATVRMQERKKLSTRKLVFFQKLDHDITLIKNRVEKIAKAKGISMAQLSLAWIMSQKGIFFSSVTPPAVSS